MVGDISNFCGIKDWFEILNIFIDFVKLFDGNMIEFFLGTLVLK